MERKFEEEIEEYYEERYGEEYHVFMVCNWTELPFEMQWGVLVGFYEEKGIIIDVQPILSYNETCYRKVNGFIPNIVKLNDPESYELPETETRLEAQTVLLEKAEQLLNKQSK